MKEEILNGLIRALTAASKQKLTEGFGDSEVGGVSGRHSQDMGVVDHPWITAELTANEKFPSGEFGRVRRDAIEGTGGHVVYGSRPRFAVFVGLLLSNGQSWWWQGPGDGA